MSEPQPMVFNKEEDENIIKVTKAMSSATRFRIVVLLFSEEMDISTIAERLQQTEANVSAQVKQLERANLVTSRYTPGEHGVRKICKTAITSLTINIADQA